MAQKDLEEPARYDRFAQQNQELQRELDELKAERRIIWPLLVEISRRLQVSSASIKAAVSSLLSYDIFWDIANQHEFLETIDNSVDQAAQLLTLLSLASRLEADSLEIKREPHVLQEIIAGVQAGGTKRFPKLILELQLPPVEKSVWVDYRYLLIALSLLFEVIEARMGSSRIIIRLSEGPEDWSLDVDGPDSSTILMIQEIHDCFADMGTLGTFLSPEYILKLHIICKLFGLLGVATEAVPISDEKNILRLRVPATGGG
jgi:signal transduction histidine kinase